MGTPYYMSPEQASADREPSAASDVYSLGCVLYEMLVGDPPYMGSSAQAVLAKILMGDAPTPTATRASIPANVDAAIRKSLEKLPADRFRSVQDFAKALGDAGFRHGHSVETAGTTGAPTATAGAWNRVTVAMTSLAALFALLFAWQLLRPPAPSPVSRHHIVLPADAPLAGRFARIALSPDGSRLVYTRGISPGELWIRDRDDLAPRKLVGSEGAWAGFFSPDGTRVGFLTSSELRFVPADGGPPVTLADSLVGPAGGAWSSDGFIYTDGAFATPLARVAESGAGGAQWFTRLDSVRGELDHLFPTALPNGKGVIFQIRTSSSVEIGVARTDTGEHRALLPGTYGVYVESGHLLWTTVDGRLMAQRFDQEAMELEGEATALIEGLAQTVIGAPDMAVSSAGTLIYAVGGANVGGEPVWVDRDGRTESIGDDWPGTAVAAALSPDQSALALALQDGSETHIWVRDLLRRTMTKLTFEGSSNTRPTWTPEGREVVFTSDRVSMSEIFMRRADGTTEAEHLSTLGEAVFEAEVTADEGWVIHRVGGGGAANIYATPLTGDSTRLSLAISTYQEVSPTVSPDGRWLAFASDETGQSEVYVRSFPDLRGKWVVSRSGGTEPVWSKDGSELFYRDGSGNLVAVDIATDQAPPLGQQRILFSASGFHSEPLHRAYDAAADGQRFLMLRIGAEGGGQPELIVVENFFEELRQRLGN
jgi:serine/threonine-protein kinase